MYGVGAAKLSRETGMSQKEAKALLEAYWKRNWAVKKLASDQYVKELSDGSLWLKNPVSGFYYNLRYDKDRWSTLNQGTGVFVFDTWVMFCRKLGLKISMTYHDEVLLVVPKGQQKETSEKLHEAMRKTNAHLGLNVEINIEEKFGQSYASVH